VLAKGKTGGEYDGVAALFEMSAASLLAHHELRDEVFGAAGLVMRCKDFEELEQVIDALEGQLTVAIHVDDNGLDGARRLVPQLEMLAGRLLAFRFRASEAATADIVRLRTSATRAIGFAAVIGPAEVYEQSVGVVIGE
jgi:NADP-dependent aldehyde dehydrogenase